MPASFTLRCFLFHLLVALGSGAKLSLMCSGVSRYLPDRLTLFFLSRSPPPRGGPQDVAGHVRLRDSAGEIYNQELSAVCSPEAPLSSTATLADVTDFVLRACGSVIGKSGRLLELSSTTKITCYKSYPDMPPLDFVAGLSLGSDHFVFSTYSLPLRLAVEAEAHEGDVIAEDHHCYIRCFFYSVMKEAMRRSGQTSELSAGFGAKTQLRPVFLPVKATSVVSETALQTWKDRWLQAKRHAQGVAEVSCIVLSAADALRQLPFHLWTWQFTISVARMAGRLMYIHMLPSCQFIATIFLALNWVCNGFQIQLCGSDTRYPLLCGAAGAWNPAWPAIPITVFIVACSISMVFVVYLQPLERGHFQSSLWTSEAGGLPQTCGSSFWTLSGLVLWDCLLFAGILVLPYGIMVEILAFWNVAFRGNRFEYVTATKALATEMQNRPLLNT